MIDSTQFRKELVKIMPGYKWTIHRPYSPNAKYICATGIQTSGFNRMSTLQVIVSEKDGQLKYNSKSAGSGKISLWLSEFDAPTLAQSLRGLQNYYEIQASNYARHANDLKLGRIDKGE